MEELDEVVLKSMKFICNYYKKEYTEIDKYVLYNNK